MTATHDEILINPGDVMLDKIEIESITGELFDISGIMIELNIYEDIFSNGITGDVAVIDAVNLFNVVPIIGQEVIRIKFKTPVIDPDPMRELTFHIYKASRRTFKNDNTQAYVLHFASPGTIKNALTKIHRTIGINPEDQNSTGQISDMVNEIVARDLAHEEEIPQLETIVPTQGTYQFVIPYWSPYKTINWLAKRAVPTSGGNDNSGNPADKNYVFFETINPRTEESESGLVYNFLPIGFLYGQKSRHENTFFFGPVPRAAASTGKLATNIKDMYYTITSYEVLDSMDTLSAIRSGMFASKLISYDMNTKKITTKEYDYIKEFENEASSPTVVYGKHDTRNPLTIAGTNAGGFKFHKEPDSFIQRYDTHSQYHDAGLDMNPQEWVLERQSAMAQMKMQRIRCEVPGNSYLRAGDVFEVFIPLMGEKPAGPEQDKYMSGKYIITSLRHMVQKSGYFSTMELAKNAFYNQLPEAKDTEPNSPK